MLICGSDFANFNHIGEYQTHTNCNQNQQNVAPALVPVTIKNQDVNNTYEIYTYRN